MYSFEWPTAVKSDRDASDNYELKVKPHGFFNEVLVISPDCYLHRFSSHFGFGLYN